MVLCSSSTLTTFGKEMRLCSKVSLLVVSGMVSFFRRLRSAGALSVLWGLDSDGHLFLENVLFHLLLRFLASVFALAWSVASSLLGRWGSRWAASPREGA